MAYAVRDDVLARAGRFAGVFSVPGKRPNEADLDALLETVSDLVDAEIRARGYDPATITAELAGALLDVVAWAVLLRALPEATLGDSAVDDLLDRGQEILRAAGFPGLATGTMDVFAGLDALSAGAEGGGAVSAGAGSTFDDLEPWEPVDELDVAALEPQWRRGQSL